MVADYINGHSSMSRLLEWKTLYLERLKWLDNKIIFKYAMFEQICLNLSNVYMLHRPCLFELPSSSLPQMDIHLASVTHQTRAELETNNNHWHRSLPRLSSLWNHSQSVKTFIQSLEKYLIFTKCNKLTDLLQWNPANCICALPVTQKLISLDNPLA